ncbi:MAG: hypothetical protein HY518_05345 [Candidatus Aenigmarchaeota archaeon]|nr:hypothetical protein [Candidatus Aenigmarchaeota archaeon]
MLIIDILKTKAYGPIAAVSAAIMLIAYPYAQTLGYNIDLWFEIITPFNLALYMIFSALFGILLSLQIYNLRQPKACRLKSAGSGAAGSFISFMAIQCPGCISIASLFLPIATTTVLAIYNIWITLAGIGLLVIGLYLLGGFKNTETMK